MQHRLGVDIGGTFTDFAILDVASGRLATHKQLTTSEDPSIAVLDGWMYAYGSRPRFLLQKRGLERFLRAGTSSSSLAPII